MGLTQGIVSFVPPQGRLTLTSATPVLTATVSAAGTVYYTPYQGAFIPIYDGANFVMAQFAELSNVLANAATGNAGPAAAANNSNYDLFVWNNAGVLTLTRGPLWTSDTARGSGAGTTQLTLTNGVYLNTVAITNGPAALRGTYVGTIRTNGTATTDMNFGSAASGGGQAILGVWNAYNRVPVAATVRDSTASWTYSSATVRAANGNSNNSAILIRGLDEDFCDVSYVCNIQSSTVGSSFGLIYVGLDATNAQSTGSTLGQLQTPTNTVAENASLAARYLGLPGLGKHQFYGLESSDGTNNATFAAASTKQALLVAVRA